MKISIGADHGGFELRQSLVEALHGEGVEIIDHGTSDRNSVDYPDYARLVGADVTGGKAEFGVLVCTTGIGMSISANKIKGVRAALVHSEDDVIMSRRHNNANVLVLAGKTQSGDEALRYANLFLNTAFDGGRHQRRVCKIGELEDENLTSC